LNTAFHAWPRWSLPARSPCASGPSRTTGQTYFLIGNGMGEGTKKLTAAGAKNKAGKLPAKAKYRQIRIPKRKG
jgi:hypothetical protein